MHRLITGRNMNIDLLYQISILEPYLKSASVVMTSVNLINKSNVCRFQTNVLYNAVYGSNECSSPICDWFKSKGSCLFRSLISVPGMALVQTEKVRSRVFTAKCSEPQVHWSNLSGWRKWCSEVLSLRTETWYKAKWNEDKVAYQTEVPMVNVNPRQ